MKTPTTAAPQPDALLRLKQITGDRKANPPIEPIIPASPATIWRWVSDGRFPKPIKIGPMCTAWRKSEVMAFIANATATAGK